MIDRRCNPAGSKSHPRSTDKGILVFMRNAIISANYTPSFELTLHSFLTILKSNSRVFVIKTPFYGASLFLPYPKPAGATPLHPAKGQSTKNKDQKTLAIRKPRKSSASSVPFQLRSADRKPCGSSNHEPPRTTRRLQSPPLASNQTEPSTGAF